MTVTAYTADNWTLLLKEERVLQGKTWRFQLPIGRDFWEDIFDQIDHEASPKTSAEAYKRDPEFWHWLVTAEADAAARVATADVSVRTVGLSVPSGNPKVIYDRFKRT
jgi:hypothetical protein